MSDIKRRIKSIESTIKITSAMKLVSAAKLRKAKIKFDSVKPFFAEIYENMVDLASRVDVQQLRYVHEHKKASNKALYIVVGGDRGLAGGFHLNLFKKVVGTVDKKKVVTFPIGKIAISFFRKNGFEILSELSGISEEITPEKVYHITARVLRNYDYGAFDEIYLAYTGFMSTLSQEPMIKKILPLDFGSPKQGGSKRSLNYDPAPGAVFAAIVPQYFAGMLYGGIVESFAAEQAARSNAMESATGNAEEIITDLTLKYNRARQFAVTTEIIEIVSGGAAG
ncbi:MAG: ATP synthase F1 subunit gamma [Oscillospiraceae bacterium]|jgi:F-type H+-transporting ATPase subunit gamma|nr:ATP synthase F1 subunit gamma [Oscillospiraceae bacterium]